MSIFKSLGRILKKMEYEMELFEVPSNKIESDVINKMDNDDVSEKDLKKLLISSGDKNVIVEDEIIEEGKKNPKAKVRNRPNPIFDSKSPKVKDDRDHFPIGNIRQARNALARAAQFSSAPKWYRGSLSEFKSAVKRAVKKAYPSIEISES